MNTKRFKTIDILWGRIMGGLNPEDYSDWASDLMISGFESKEAIYLASNRDLHWQEIENLFPIIMTTLEMEIPKTLEEFCLMIEKMSFNDI